MPIYLKAPRYNPGGPDGKGWNRLSITGGSHMCGDECALRPRSYAALAESRNTARASYGAYGPCSRKGDCHNCPIYNAPPTRLNAFGDRVLVRIDNERGRNQPHLMNREEDGWNSRSHEWSWEELARIESAVDTEGPLHRRQGWRIGERYRDEHGEGFWLVRDPA